MEEIATSFLIASTNPKKLSEFYALVCNGNVSNGLNSNHYLIIYRENLKIHFYKPSMKHQSLCEGPSSSALCFQKESSLDPLLKLKEWYKETLALGAEVLMEPKNEFFGAEAWMQDPEGNSFLLLVPLLVLTN